MSYGAAEIKLRASNLHIRVLATRYDLPVDPGLIIDQVPQPGEEVVYRYPVGVTIAKNSHVDGPTAPSRRPRPPDGTMALQSLMRWRTD